MLSQHFKNILLLTIPSMTSAVATLAFTLPIYYHHHHHCSTMILSMSIFPLLSPCSVPDTVLTCRTYYLFEFLQLEHRIML
jgi:hypothetical protein